jgi:hypothetical protein
MRGPKSDRWMYLLTFSDLKIVVFLLYRVVAIDSDKGTLIVLFYILL